MEKLKKPSIILEKLQQHFSPARNILYERYLFHSAEQQANETVDQYVLRLQRLAEPCKFAALHKEMLHDRLVLGSRDKAAQARLFREKDCDLHRAIDALRISEITQEQLRNISGMEEDVHAVSSTSKVQQRSGTWKPVSIEATQEKKKQTVCRYCGGQHPPDKLVCSAYGKVCRYCSKPNHFKSMCRQNQHNRQQVHYVKEGQEEDSDDSVYHVEYIGALHHSDGKKFFIPLHIIDESGDTVIQCQLDTGATCMCVQSSNMEIHS